MGFAFLFAPVFGTPGVLPPEGCVLLSRRSTPVPCLLKILLSKCMSTLPILVYFEVQNNPGMLCVSVSLCLRVCLCVALVTSTGETVPQDEHHQAELARQQEGKPQ